MAPLESVAVVLPLAASVKSMAVPVRFAVCVPLGALSVSVSVPVRGPALVGANTIDKVQAAFTASVAAQVLVTMLNAGLMLMPEMLSVRPPLLVSVSVCASELRPTPVAAKLSALGLSETPGGATPMPLSKTVCERNWSLMVSAPLRAPVAVGVKLTLNAQVECAASEVPQALTTLKSPLMDALMSVSATSPVLVSVTCCAVLVVAICCCVKVSAEGASVSVAGALPVPLSCAVCVPALSVSESDPLR